MSDYTITCSCAGPTPASQTVKSGDKVTFSNTTGASLSITFSGAGFLSPTPQNMITIGIGGTQVLTVGNVTSGEEDYTYPECGGELGTRGGKIVIG
jgi:plastocyanin